MLNSMQKLDDISIQVATDRHPLQTGNAFPVLGETRHALTQLRSSGTTAVIDLAAVPFGPRDEQRLLHWLGDGELTAELHSLGRSGVWEIDHYNHQGDRLAPQIEITNFLELVRSQPEDRQESLQHLDDVLNSLKNGEAES